MKRFLRTVFLAILTVVLPSMTASMARATQATPESPSSKAAKAEILKFIGAVIYPDICIAEFTVEDGKEAAATIIKSGDDYYGNKGAIFANGKLFCVAEFDLLGSGSDNGVFTYARLFDATNWKLLKEVEKPAKNLYATCLAQDPTTRTIYGCFQNENGNGWELGTIDIETMERTGVIRPFTSSEDRYLSMSFNSDGQLYAIGRNNGTLYRVDKTTGEYTTVGETRLKTDFLTSGEIDLRTNKYYYVEPSMSYKTLYEIDLETAEATEICELEENHQIMGFHLLTPAAQNNAPAAPTELALDFAPKSLSGKITFKAPSTNFDGSAASGELTYKVEANGKQVANGTTTYGSATTADITVDAAGNYLFRVTVANNKGDSPAAEIEQWIGQDFPLMPGKVRVTRTGIKNTISWDSVKVWEHGGDIEEAVTYTVTRYPDQKVIASDLSACTVEDEFDSETLTALSYGVCASATVKGKEGRSNTLVTGSAVPPFAETFDKGDNFNFFITLDSDKDGKCWKRNAADSTAQTEGNKRKRADDWLFTPPLAMKAGHQYSISFTAASYTPFDPATIEVRFGNAATPQAMTTVVTDTTRMAFMGSKTFSNVITVKEDGLYHVGFHSISEPAMERTILYDLEVGRGINLLAPNQVAIVVTPDEEGKPEAKISLKAPTTTMNGSTLTEITKISCLMDGKSVKEFENPTPGNTYELNVSDSKEGYHEFAFRIYNGQGEGAALETKIFLGVNQPAVPENVSIKEDGHSGKVTVSWDKVTRDIDGYAIISKFVTYTVSCNLEENALATGLTEPVFEYQVPGTKDDQEFVQFYIEAVTKAGASAENGESAAIAVGQPYTLPFTESLPGGKPSHKFMTQGYGEWATHGEEGFPGNPGCFIYVARIAGSYNTLTTGKISLEGAKAPHFSFAYNPTLDNPNYIEVSVTDLLLHETTPLGRIDLNTSSKWEEKEFDLSTFAGKNIMLGITAYSETTEYYTMIDEIKLFETDPSAANEKPGMEEEPYGIQYFPGGVEIVSYNNQPISLYSLSGVLMASGKGSVTKQLTTGLYIARIGNRSVKVIVR